MSRKLIEIVDHRLNEIPTTFLALRDLLRAQLDPLSDGSEWIVGDIVRWGGSSSIYKGLAFAVFHRSGGNNTGHAWLFGSGYDSTNNSAYMTNMWGNNTTNQNAAFLYFGNSSSSLSSSSALIFGYDNQGGSWDLGYTPNTGTHPSGDYGVPGTNPYSDLAGFRGDRYRLFAPGNASSTSFYGGIPNRQSTYIICDHDDPFIAIYGTLGYEMSCRAVIMGGNLIDTYDPADTDESAFMAFTLGDNNPHTNNGTPGRRYIQAVDNAQNYVQFTDYYDSGFGVGNSPDLNGEYPWQPVGIKNGNYYKGRLKAHLFRQIGWSGRQIGQIFDGPDHPIIKLHTAYAFPWVTGYASPFGGIVTTQYHRV